MIIAVDYDGTLSISDEYPRAGRLNLFAISILKKFRKNGGKLILHTCREGKPLAVAIAACRQEGLEFDAVNSNLAGQFELFQQKYPDAVENRKPYADLYIDDKAWLGGNIDWVKIREYIL